MTKFLRSMFLLAAICVAGQAKASPFVFVLKDSPPSQLMKADPGETKLAPMLYLAPSVGFDAFVRDNSDKSWKAGVIPGVGYGIKYRPNSWTMTQNLVSLDLFTQAMFVSDTFNIDVLPVVTLFDWVGVGFGYRFKLATSSDGRDGGGTLFSIGIRKSIASF